MRNRILFILACLLAGMPLILHAGNEQDEIQVTGTVLSEGEPLPGVSVQIKGTTTGTITDIDGHYSINAPGNAILVYSFVGMKPMEVAVNHRTVIDVIMADESQNLDEVIVVAYATAKKYSFTGAAATVKGGDIAKLQTSSISKALQGAVPGLQSTSTSGQPGTDAAIRIRGIGSINAASTPLYVLDGVPYDGNINAINPDDIASVTVLKDAASAALYGSRGANGVIIITTKQGRTNEKPTVNAKITFGVSGRAVEDYKQINTDQYFELYWEAMRNQYANDGYDPTEAARKASSELVNRLMGTGPNPYGVNYPQPVGTDGKLVSGAHPLWNTNWRKALEQTATRTDIGLNVSGGGQTNQYYFSAGYLNDKGIALDSEYKRFNLRSNITSNVTKWLTAGANIGFTHSIQNYPISEDSSTGNVIQAGRLIPSFYPEFERKADGSYKLDEHGKRIPDFGTYRPAGAIPNWNLPATLPLDKNERMRDEVSARTFLEITFPFLDGLKFKTSYNFDLINYNAWDYENPALGPAAITGGSTSRTNNRTFSWTWNNLFTYQHEFGDHHINVLLGQEAYSYRWDNLVAAREKMGMPGYSELAAGAVLTEGTGYRNNYTLTGYLSRIEYDYHNRYFLSASYRRDGSSRFAAATRWGNFWSLGGSWRIDRESFMQGTGSWLSALLLKASYGAQGNDNLGTYYASEGLYDIVSNLGNSGLISARLASPDLKWETNLNLNIGIDFAFFNNRLSGSFDFFQRRSKDLLYSRPLAPSLGYPSRDENIGTLKNTGFELEIKGTLIDTGDFQWRMGLNLTHYKNKVTELPLADMPPTGTKKLAVGRSVYDFYLREWAGVNPGNGAPQWYVTDADGNRTKTSVYADATPVFVNKSSLPDVYGGVNTSFSYKGFDLSMLLVYSIGGYILNSDITMMLGNGSTLGRAWNTQILNRWTPENRYTDVPALSTVNNSWTSVSTRFLYNASYMRVKNLTLSYTLPKTIVDKLHLGNLQVFIQGDNLFTLHHVDGMDPEQSVDGTTYYRYPAMRTLSGGINVTF